MSLDDRLVGQHTWVFSPYADLRRSGALATANEHVILHCIQAVMENLDRAFMGSAVERPIDTRYEILHVSDRYKIVDEIGGNEARYTLFAKGELQGYVSLVARRPDGRFVYTIGRRSRYVDFPVPDLYGVLSEGDVGPWGGSDLIGGSNRRLGSALTWEQIRDRLDGYFARRQKETS